MARRKVIPVAKLKAGERPVIFDLPAHLNEGIGKLIMTHAILETQISELMYDLAKIDYPAGRVSFSYRNAADRFKTIIELIEMRGIKPSIDLNKLKKQIDDCCVARDTQAIKATIGNVLELKSQVIAELSKSDHKREE
jgi:hypothetical protein